MKSYLLGTAAALVLAGCSVSTTPVTQDELRASATQELAAMFPQTQAVSGPLDVQEVVQRTLTNNLDTRLRKMETVFSTSQLKIDNLSMLPTVAANAGYSNRDKSSFSTSQVQGQADKTGSYSTSSETEVRTADLSASWNVLDMAMGYYNAKQSANRALISAERERRASMDLIQTSKEAFWRAYAAERLTSRVEANIRNANATLAKVEQGANNGAVSPMDALRQRKTVLESVRQLELLKQGLDLASLELAQMINVRPGQNYDLKAPSMAIPKLGKSLQELEQIAFTNSPDIREQNYRTRIAISDVKKTSAELFPSLSATASLNYSTDDFLLNDNWSQYGLNVGWNLIRLATAPTRMENARTGVEVEHARALAVRMAVLAKTHIAYREYLFAVEQFKREDDLYKIETALAKQNRSRSQASVATDIEILVSETSAMMAEMRRYRAYAQVVSAAERVKATVGDDSDLARALAERNRRAETASTDATTAEAAIATQSAEIERLTKDIAKLSKSREKMAMAVVKQQAKVDQATADAQATEQGVAAQTAALAGIESQNPTNGDVDAAAVKSALRSNAADLRTAKRDLAKAERSLAKAERALVKATNNAEGLEGDDLTAAQAAITSATADRDAAQTAVQANADRIAALENQAAGLSAQMDFAAQADPARNALAKAAAANETAAATLQAEQAKLAQMQSELEQTDQAIADANQALSTAAAALASAQTDLADAEARLGFYAPFNTALNEK